MKTLLLGGIVLLVSLLAVGASGQAPAHTASAAGSATVSCEAAPTPTQASWSPAGPVAGWLCKSYLQSRGYTCPWDPPRWWPFGACVWYGLTCAQAVR